jgi:hypothetical protein
MKTFEKYLDKMGYSWNDFDRTYEMGNLIEKYADERVKQALNIGVVVESKPNEKAALNHAVDAIYFSDNSDYLSGLYGVVRSLTGLEEPTEEDITKLFKDLNPE